MATRMGLLAWKTLKPNRQRLYILYCTLVGARHRAWSGCIDHRAIGNERVSEGGEKPYAIGGLAPGVASAG